MPVHPSSERGIERLETVRMKRYALDARLRKEPYSHISEQLGVSVGTVRSWVKEMTQVMLPQEDLEELRAQQAAGVDASERRLLAGIEAVRAQIELDRQTGYSVEGLIEMLVKLETRLEATRKERALLLGLNKPIQVEHAHKVRTTFDEEVESLVSALLGGGTLLSDPDMVDVDEEG